MKKMFIVISFPLLILFFGKCGKEEEWTEIDISPCNVETEFIREYPETEVLLFQNEVPEKVRNSGKKYIVSTDEEVILSYKMEMEGWSDVSYICNFPNEIKWDIPLSGLPLLITGNLYMHDSGGFPEYLQYYLELTILKK